MMLCDKCGKPIEGPAGRCLHCDPQPYPARRSDNVPFDPARSPACVICTAPLFVDKFGILICTGCNRSEQLCGCGPNGITQGGESEHAKVSMHEPKAQWWFERLQRLVALLRGATGLNRAGDFLIKFALYSTFIDLAEEAAREGNKKIYERAVKLLHGEEDKA